MHTDIVIHCWPCNAFNFGHKFILLFRDIAKVSSRKSVSAFTFSIFFLYHFSILLVHPLPPSLFYRLAFLPRTISSSCFLLSCLSSSSLRASYSQFSSYFFYLRLYLLLFHRFYFLFQFIFPYLLDFISSQMLLIRSIFSIKFPLFINYEFSYYYKLIL